MRRLLLHFGFFEVAGPDLDAAPAKDQAGCQTQEREHRSIVEIEVSLALSPFRVLGRLGSTPRECAVETQRDVPHGTSKSAGMRQCPIASEHTQRSLRGPEKPRAMSMFATPKIVFFFKPVPGGFVYAAPNPWGVGRTKHYFVTATQRDEVTA